MPKRFPGSGIRFGIQHLAFSIQHSALTLAVGPSQRLASLSYNEYAAPEGGTMVRLMVVLVVLLVSSIASAQPAVRTIRTWHVDWRSATQADGSVTQMPVLRWAEPDGPPPGERYAAPVEIEAVVRLDDRLRAAERTKDAARLDRMLSEQFSQTDVNGVERDKRATLQFLFQSDASTWMLGRMTARADNNAVVLTGEETDGSSARRHFTRVFVRDAAGQWKLLSSTTVVAGR
jgi:ketosteroid isomerase-like protein